MLERRRRNGSVEVPADRCGIDGPWWPFILACTSERHWFASRSSWRRRPLKFFFCACLDRALAEAAVRPDAAFMGRAGPT